MLRAVFTGCLLFFSSQFACAQVTFVIESLPAGTPGTDTVFICGSFNNWVPNDPRYALQRQLNGHLAVTIPEGAGTIEYKFTRGSWTKVETDDTNRYTRNRTFTFGTADKVFVSIDNWLDQGGVRKLNYIIFYFFACAFQGIALCLLVFRIHKKDKGKWTAFLATNAVLTGLLILMVLNETVNQIWQSYFTFIFHILLFCWGPLLWLYIHTFAAGTFPHRIRQLLIPATLAAVLVVIRILNIRMFDFLSGAAWKAITCDNVIFFGASLVFNLSIAFRALKRFSFLRHAPAAKREARENLLYYFYHISLAAMLMVPLNAVLILSGVRAPFVDNFHAIAVLLSMLVFAETYFFWKYPEIIREEKLPAVPGENAHYWVEKLDALMKHAKPYKKADLSVSDLAEMLGTKPHILSKVINDGYHKNFRDYVNSYRIAEFITLAGTKEFRHYTFLALAQEVGFNSKSTFNLAFKKQTRKSPRDYFKSGELPAS
jgi:AraC-like DNA-binding protein